ncbi:MAG: lipoprotein insertase outer membrane protein LolB [Pseudomonadales bacterium]|nr:lipoprotein insertase outer membrane protein LolB [Pseudomonadales bacterium]
MPANDFLRHKNRLRNDTRKLLLKLITATLLVNVLHGCSLISTQEPLITNSVVPETWPMQHRMLSTLTHWSINGKIGIRQPGQSESAAINNGSQRGEHYNIDLSSLLLGMGAIHIEGNLDYILLSDSDEQNIYSDDPESLLEQHAGWTLPLAYIADWVKGIPSPGSPYRLEFTAEGRLAHVEQSGWTVTYRNFLEVGDYPLPAKITITDGERRIIIVINQWQLL